MRTLNDVKIGEKVRVTKLNSAGPLKRKIMDMGLTKGAQITMNKIAPLGDPLEVTVRGYELSLRKDEAKSIEIE